MSLKVRGTLALESTKSPTENYRDITTPSIKDENSPFLHSINGADLCRQPLAEWLKSSLNTGSWEPGNKGVQMGRERRQPPAAWSPPSFPSVQHTATTSEHPGNHSSSEIVNKPLWFWACVYFALISPKDVTCDWDYWWCIYSTLPNQ